VPVGWTFPAAAAALLGAIENKTQPPPEGAGVAKRLIVRGTALFGGVEIKN
jgi:hypothetical protein